ncbi:MAG: hypothetical protein AVDCRST_MAG74-2640 [uncultured Pyrinomonadaceae bacterium]|uniref:Uncharacterized protein n=1 Tax=uncultured Pyrinomonadaceae bacterium TaxID=2283094 RepID=A0A6J4PLM5_9BACT|nr:MAG: hypothetical protein AVDCRST_MAG74-2640 [uncultured Pyrinomonadaceae bacterium]
MLKFRKKAIRTYWHIVISILASVAIYFFQIPFPLIVLGAAITEIISPKYKVGRREIKYFLL